LDTLPCNPIKITDHLYQLGSPSIPMCLSLGEEAMLIEGGTGPTAQMITGQVRLLGIEPTRIRHMALPHTHPDHIGAIPRLRRLSPHMEILFLCGLLLKRSLKEKDQVQFFPPRAAAA
jgi:2-aminobenzoylacetyl-CoA thioesterase